MIRRGLQVLGRRHFCAAVAETTTNGKPSTSVTVTNSEDRLVERAEGEVAREVITNFLKNRKMLSRDVADLVNEIASTGLVRDKTLKTDLSEMDSEDSDVAVRPVNRFRKIVYSEGELHNSDLSQPASPENPHPFDPSVHPLPPTHARSLAAYVNYLPTLQNLVDLGVNLLEIDTTTVLGRHLVRMDWDKDVMPKLQWLRNEVGVKPQEMGAYLTRNPFFLIQDVHDLQTRVNYLQTKLFNKKQITKICTENRYWLNTDVKLTDSRLGWLQNQFELQGKEVRALIIKEPRVIQFGIGPLQRVTMMVNKEWGFSNYQMKLMLMRDPRIWMTDNENLSKSYNYLVNDMKITHAQLLKCPLALRVLRTTHRVRHAFLQRLKRDQFVESVPDYIPLSLFVHESDKVFAEKAGRCELQVYNEFLKRF